MVRVIVVEDDPATRALLCDAVTRECDLELVGNAGDHESARNLLASVACDVVLMDLDLHGVPSTDLVGMAARNGDTQVLVISALGDEASVIAAIEAGAEGYILKDGAFVDINTPIRQLREGQAPISPGVARHLLRRIRPVDTIAHSHSVGTMPAPEFSLTAREQQVLTLFAHGASYKEVANRLDISLHTVRDHVKALYRKLRAHSRGMAVRRALAHGLVRMPDP